MGRIIRHKTKHLVNGPLLPKNVVILERDHSRKHDIRAISTKGIVSHTYFLLSFSALVAPDS
jgi:hypothetical protein